MLKTKSVLLASAVAFITALPASAQAEKAQSRDQYEYLENTGSPEVTKWVEGQNKRTADEMTSDPRFEATKAALIKGIGATDRIPEIGMDGGYIYNLWKDADHKRGLWRRTTLEEFSKAEPKWDVILDLDKLAEQEKEDWSFGFGRVNELRKDRALIGLSKGGKDALVVREFDMEKRTFVKDGFFIPEAKTAITWLDADTVLLGTETGPDSVTTSGYPRELRLLKRGQDILSAPVIFSIGKTDTRAQAASDTDALTGERHTYLIRNFNFYDADIYEFVSEGVLRKLQIPPFVDFAGTYAGQFILTSRMDWRLDGRVFKAGSVISMSRQAVIAGPRAKDAQVLFEPQANSALKGLAISKAGVVMSVLRDVKSSVIRATWDGKTWSEEAVKTPENASIGIAASSSESHAVLLEVESFLLPSSLMSLQNGRLETIKQRSATFDASEMVSDQLWATSKDGTRVPFFIVHKKGLKLDGRNPVLAYAYGGFQDALTPVYLANKGKLWLEKGGIMIYANLRGGGEFGPDWHQAGIRDKKQNTIDDFAAVLKEVIARGYASPATIAIQGGSNGGLVACATAIQYPELMAGAMCAVPLLDMLRYHKLLAGASWIPEYGDPDVAADVEFLRKISPYHNIEPGRKSPVFFLSTSTTDDRVHPGHARKMAAKLQDSDCQVYFFEATGGGHTGSESIEETAHDAAMEYVFLYRLLMGKLSQ